jgi:hypothetical protein
MAIPDIEANGFAMELLKDGLIRIVNKHELSNLVLVNTSPKIKDKSYLHLGGNV